MLPWGPQPEPTLDPLFAWHRGTGYMTFARATATEPFWDDWNKLGAVSVSEPLLPEVWEALAPWLDVDAYVSLNSLRAIRTQRTSLLTGLPLARRKKKNLAALNGCYCDLDIYSRGLTPTQAMGRIFLDVHAGRVPEPTVWVRSGRGLWLLFAFDAPLVPSFAALDAFVRIQKRLLDVLKPYGADKKSAEPAHVAPLPGTLKSKSNARVQWTLTIPPPLYSLEQLAGTVALDVPAVHRVVADVPPQLPADVVSPAKRRRYDERPRDATKQRAGRLGWRARWERPRAELMRLVAWRGGGFDDGCRNAGALALVATWLRAGYERADAYAALTRYADACRPPLTPVEVEKAWCSGSKRRGFSKDEHAMLYSYAGLWDALSVSADEASAALLETFDYQPRQRVTRTTAERRAAILAIVRAKHRVFTWDAMVEQLHDEGFDVSRSTVRTDYHFLGLRPDVKRGRRPRTLPLDMSALLEGARTDA